MSLILAKLALSQFVLSIVAIAIALPFSMQEKEDKFTASIILGIFGMLFMISAIVTAMMSALFWLWSS